MDFRSAISAIQSKISTSANEIGAVIGKKSSAQHPRITKAIKQLLKHIEQETKRSLKHLPSVKQNSFGPLFESTIKSIDSLAHVMLTCEHVTTQNLEQILKCEENLSKLQNSISEARDQQEIDLSLGNKVEAQVENANSLLAQVERLAKALVEYQKKANPLVTIAQEFSYQSDQDPLQAINAFKSLMAAISKFEKEIQSLMFDQSEMVTVKLESLLALQAEEIENEFGVWVGGLAKSLQKHIRRLKYFHLHPETKNRESVQKQIGALQQHIAYIQRTISAKALPSLVNHIKTLHSVLHNAQSDLSQLGKFESEGLAYGSSEWERIVAVTGDMPKGIFNHIFTHLTSANYLSKSRGITTKQMRNAFVISLVTAASFSLVKTLFAPSVSSQPITVDKQVDNTKGDSPKWHKHQPTPPVVPPDQKVPNKPRLNKVVSDVDPIIDDTAPVPYTIDDEIIDENGNLIPQKEIDHPKPFPIPDIVNPIIDGLGVAKNIIEENPDDDQLRTHIWKGVKNINGVKKKIKALEKKRQVADPTRKEIHNLSKKLDVSIANIPSYNCSIADAAFWLQQTTQQVCKLQFLCDKIDNDPTLDIPEVIVPEQFEDPYWKESSQLVHETIQLPAKAPSDKIYANLISLYTPELDNAYIAKERLEGLSFSTPLDFLVDTQKAYLEALKTHLEFSQACPEGNCTNAADKFGSEVLVTDYALVKDLVEKIEFASSLFSLDYLQQDKQIKKRFTSLKPGENFFFVAGWKGNKPAGHAVIIEIEKDPKNAMTLRLFNLGAGNTEQAKMELLGIPFTEIVEVNPKRVTGGAFAGFINTIMNSDLVGDQQTTPTFLHDVLRNSLGGKISAQLVSSDLLRNPQYVGNCGIASTFAIFDKNLVRVGLAERMRALTLFRATKAYYAEQLAAGQLEGGEERESRRRMLAIGAQVAFEAIERAIEVGGLVGEGALELLTQTQKIQEAVAELHAKDFGTLQNAALIFDKHPSWSMPKFDVDASKLYDPSITPKPSFKLRTPATPSTKPKGKAAPAKRKGKFTPAPFKNHALEALIELSKKQSTQVLPTNRAALITPLELDEVFALGFQDARNLMLAGNTPTLKITDNLALFDDNLADFLDLDRLQIVQTLLLNPTVLARNIATDVNLVDSIGNFCHTGRNIGHLVQSAATESFFAYLSRTIQQTLNKISANSAQEQEIDTSKLPNARDVFKQLIEVSDHETEVSRLTSIHAYRLKSFELHEMLTAEELGELLSSINYLKTHDYPADIFVNVAEEISRIWNLVENSHTLFEDPETANELLNEIALGVNPHHQKCLWHIHPTGFAFTNADQTMQYDPSTGILDRLTLGSKRPPKVLAEDPVFRAILGNAESLYLDRISEKVYIYQDAAGTNYRFIMTDHGPVTQKEYAKNWYQALDPKAIPSFPIALVKNGAWVDGGIFWAPLKDGRYFYYTSPQKALTVQFDKGKSSAAELVTSSLEETGLTLIDPVASTLSETISRIEDPKFTFSFAKAGSIAYVQLPRLGLEFGDSAKDAIPGKVLATKKLNGFGLAEGMQRLPFLGDFAQYLPLKKIDAKGRTEEAVIIPFLPFAKQETERLKTPTTLKALPDSWKESIPYFFYRVKGNILLPEVTSKTEAVQANLHLSMIFLSERRYNEALRYLTITDKILKSLGQAVSQEMIDSLVQVANFFRINDDMTPDAAAVRLHARAIIQRLQSLNLISINLQIIPCKDDYELYDAHMQRVNASLKLSKEKIRHLARLKIMQEQALSMPLAEDSGLTFPAPRNAVTLMHPLSTFKGSQTPISMGAGTFRTQALAIKGLTAGEIVVTLHPLFMEGFPEAIVPLYALLKEPQDIGLSKRRILALQFGLDPALSAEELRLSMTTLVELRYRYLIDRINVHSSSDFKEENKLSALELLALGAERDLLGALITVARMEQPEVGDFGADVTKFHELAATLRTNPDYEPQIAAFDELTQSQTTDALKEALRLWEAWIQPKALPIPLGLERTAEITKAFIGPVLTEPLMQLADEQEVSTAFDVNYAIELQQPIGQFGVDEAAFSTIKSYFEATPIATLHRTSPFGKKALSPGIDREFNSYDAGYKEYLTNNAVPQANYQLLEEGALKIQTDEFEKKAIILNANVARREDVLKALLNKFSEDPAQSLHKQVRFARHVKRKITVDDAKVGVARGWDIKYLKTLNPALELQEIEEIYDQTIKMLLELREAQRLQRMADAIDGVLTFDRSGDPWQYMVAKMLKLTDETINYNPYDHPLLLLTETEYNIALWTGQIPAILNLAPRDRINALYELAMGQGKTDVIAPAVLALLADGHTVPVFVTTEPLLPSVTARLQQRLDEGYSLEVRNIPIERRMATTEDVNALRAELEQMRDNRIPLTWSSSDVQTLINSFIENWINPPTKLKNNELMAYIGAWQDLFGFMRNHFVFLGDEIHAVLDILTTYNFALGIKSPLTINEREAVADFLAVYIEHESVANKISMPALKLSGPLPFTKEYFDKTIAPQLIDTLIARGITNDPRSRELFAASPEIIKKFVAYLSSTLPSSLKTENIPLFPAVNQALIDRLEKNKAYQTEVDDVLKMLPLSDQKALRSKTKNQQLLATELKRLDQEYKNLNQRIYDFAAVQKESLRTVFSLTSMAQLGKHYVMNRKGTGAIPADNGTPLWDSEFGNSLERLLYTHFLFSQQGVERDVVKKDAESFVERFRTRITEFLQNIPADGQVGSTLEDELSIAFKERYGNDFHLQERGFNDVQIDLMTKWVNEKPERQIPFIRDYKFPEQTMHSQEIETTTHMFPMLTKKEGGFAAMTGTSYNRQVYPPVFGKVILSPTIFMVTEAILRTSPQVVLTIPNGLDPTGNLDSLYNNSILGPGGVIDSTGRIEKSKNFEYAKLMLEKIHAKKPHITRIAYYEGDTLMMLRLGQDHPTLHDDSLPVESLEALWDVSHNTGSNIIVGKNAHAFLIVGKHARLFELAQSVMRLRGHGQGQVVELAVFEDDRAIIAEKLSKEFGYEFAPDQPLTTEQIVQYALLNEVIEEMDNNWRAIDMRMKMAMLEPLMDIVWNPQTPPDKALAVFNVAKPLFFKERVGQPSDLYGMSISKVEVQKAIQALLKSWKQHPVLENIKKSPELLANIDVGKIERKLEEIANASHGPLQDKVDSHNYLGQKQRVKDNVQDKVQINAHIQTKQNEKQQEKTKLSMKVREVVTERNRIIPPIRRNPYAPRPVLPISENIFERSAYTTLSLAEATHSSLEQLAPAALRKIGRGASISITELIGLDHELMNTLQLRDNDISVSLNLAPVWIDKNSVAPLYAPYNFFQKFASHALLIQNKDDPKDLKLMLVDGNDAELLLQKMKEDRDNYNPNIPHEVNLTLYHLQSNRIIASGATPVELDHLPTQMRSNELLAQAKLLSGMKKYTKTEVEYLSEWVAAKGLESGKPVERKPPEILRKFIFQMALNREETLLNFEKSDLAKVFIAQGITVEKIQEMLNHPLVKCAKEMRFLLFDRSLTPKEWLEKVQQIKAELNTDLKEYTGQWSDIITPLLPVLFEIPEGHGVATRNGYGFYNPTTNAIDEAGQRAIRRRVLMNIFFSSLADEYGAWRTAMPRLVGKEDEPSRMSQLFGRAYGAKGDVDLTYLTEAFADKPYLQNPTIATFEQLETMSELAHPVWGLPRLAYQFDAISSSVYGKLSTANDAALYMPEQTIAKVSNYVGTAKNIAQHAIAHVDLVASLRALDKTYEFERLHGVFAFLAHNNISPDARREYALEMLPRLYGNKFGNDMRFYTRFIPEELTVSTQEYTEVQISNLLQRCYIAAKNAKGSHWWTNYSLDYEPSTKELSLALRKLAKEAPKDVAQTTAKWLNTLLSTQPDALPWLGMLLFQMMARRDEFPLIHHRDYGAYFSKEMQKNMMRASEYEADTSLSYTEGAILRDWELADFDLYADLAKFNTLHKPLLTPYQKAQKWTAVFKANPHALRTPSQPAGSELASIWHKILGPIAQELRASPPTNDADKASLRHLLELLDAHSMDMQDNTFNEFMKELADIRLAADYSFDPIKNRDFAMQEIKKLASLDEAVLADSIRSRVYFNFIPNYLLPKQEAQKMPAETVRTLLTGLHKDSINYPKFAHWRRMFNEVLAPLTDEGTKEQYNSFITWVNELLVKGDTLAPMDDYAVLRVLNYPNKIEHQKLVKYVRGREGDFIAKVIVDAGSSISGLEGLAQIFSRHEPVYKDLIYGDFDFFADLFELKTANRPQLSYADYAKKMQDLVAKIPTEDWAKASLREFLNLKFSVIDGRFRHAHPSGSVKNPEVSALVQTLDERCDAMFKVCTDPGLPNLVASSYLLRRISDFADSNENVNIQKAALEYLKMDKKPFREKAYEYAFVQLTGNHRNGKIDWIEPTFTKLADTAQVDIFSHTKFAFCFAPRLNLLVPIANEMLGGTTTTKPTLDYVLQKLWTEQAQVSQRLDYNNLKKYIDLRANSQRDTFIRSWLTFGKTTQEKVKIEELITLADDKLDILTKIVGVEVNNPPPLKADELAAALAKYIANPGNFSDLQQAASEIALNKLTDMFNRNPPSPAESMAISRLVQAIDKRCDESGDRCLTLILPADRLRMLADFSAPDVNKNMQKAVTEFFQISSISSFKRDAYKRLINNLERMNSKDKAWAAPTFEIVIDNFKNSPLTFDDQTMLKELFDNKLPDGMVSLSASIDNKLRAAKQPSPILDFALLGLGENLSQVSHSSISTYLSRRSSVERVKFIQSWAKQSFGDNEISREFVVIFENDFDALANLLDLKTLNQPILNSRNLIESLTTYISRLERLNKDQFAATKAIMEKLTTDTKSLTSTEKASLSTLIEAIDKKANQDKTVWQSLVDLSNKLRRVVEFTNVPNNDLQKIAVKYFSLDVNNSPFTHEAYKRLLKEMMDTVGLATTDRSKLFNDVLDAFKKDMLSPVDQELIDKLFTDVERIRAPLNAKLGESSQGLAKLSSQRHPVVDFFVRKLGRNLSGISFNHLNTYFNSMWPAEKDSFIALWLDALETDLVKRQQLKELARLVNKDLANLVNLLGITIDSKPALKTSDLTALLRTYVHGGVASDLRQNTVLKVLGKLQDLAPYSQVDKEAISSVLDSVETSLNYNLDVMPIKETLLGMRLKIDFSGSSAENLSKLIDGLLGDNLSFPLRSDYTYKLPKILFKEEERGNVDIIMSLLDKVNAANSEHVTSTLRIITNFMDKVDEAEMAAAIENGLLRNSKPYKGEVAASLYWRIGRTSADFDFTALNKIWSSLSNADKKIFAEEICRGTHGADFFPTNFYSLFDQNDFSVLAKIARISPKNMPTLTLSEVLAKISVLIDRVQSSDSDVNINQARVLLDFVITKLPAHGWFQDTKLAGSEGANLRELVAKVEARRFKAEFSALLSKMKKYL